VSSASLAVLETETRESEVVARILDGAGRAFAEHGVSGAGMREIARHAGCSRATLYRHFDDRHALHVAFVEYRTRRLMAELEAELGGVDEPAERLIELVLRSVAKVRDDPSMAAWFEPTQAGVAARMSRGSEVIDRLGGAFAANWSDGRNDALRLRSRFVVRVIVSLLTTPGEDGAEERAMVSQFVVPALLGGLRANR